MTKVNESMSEHLDLWNKESKTPALAFVTAKPAKISTKEQIVVQRILNQILLFPAIMCLADLTFSKEKILFVA